MTRSVPFYRFITKPQVFGHVKREYLGLDVSWVPQTIKKIKSILVTGYTRSRRRNSAREQRWQASWGSWIKIELAKVMIPVIISDRREPGFFTHRRPG